MEYLTCFSHLEIGDLEARHPRRKGLCSRREHRKAGDHRIVREGFIKRAQSDQTKGTTETTHETPRGIGERYRTDYIDK